MSPVRRTNAAGCSPSRRMKSASFFSARTPMSPNVSPAPRFEPGVSWLEPTAPPPSAGTSAPWVEPTVHFAGTSSSLLLVSSWMPLPASSSSLSPSSLSRSLAVSLSHCHSLSLSTLVLLLNILSLIFHRLAHLMVFLSSCLSHLSPPLFVLLFLFLVLSSSSFPPFLPSGWPEDDKLTLCVVLFRTSLVECNIAARASPRHA